LTSLSGCGHRPHKLHIACDDFSLIVRLHFFVAEKNHRYAHSVAHPLSVSSRSAPLFGCKRPHDAPHFATKLTLFGIPVGMRSGGRPPRWHCTAVHFLIAVCLHIATSIIHYSFLSLQYSLPRKGIIASAPAPTHLSVLKNDHMSAPTLRVQRQRLFIPSLTSKASVFIRCKAPPSSAPRTIALYYCDVSAHRHFCYNA